MSRLFNWFRKQPQENTFDLANGQWDPVPSAATGTQTDWSQWLQEEPQLKKGSSAREESSPLVKAVLAVAEEQRPTEPSETSSPFHISPSQSSPTRNSSTQREKKWTDVMANLGEHLTDEELRIIREQISR